MNQALQDLIEHRRTTNVFEPNHTISDEQIEHLVHLATRAPTSFNLQNWRFLETGKNRGYPNFASDVSCVPGCRGDSVARHSSFKTWSRLGVGDRLRGSHLDQDQVSLSSQPPVFPGLQSDASSFRRRSGITFKPVEQLLKGAFHQSSPTWKSCA